MSLIVTFFQFFSLEYLSNYDFLSLHHQNKTDKTGFFQLNYSHGKDYSERKTGSWTTGMDETMVGKSSPVLCFSVSL